MKIMDAQISARCSEGQADNRVYHLALKPSLYRDTLTALAESGSLDESSGTRRVVIEKPFGTDYKSARELNSLVHSLLSEDQVFRIDHYLGKDRTLFRTSWCFVLRIRFSSRSGTGITSTMSR